MMSAGCQSFGAGFFGRVYADILNRLLADFGDINQILRQSASVPTLAARYKLNREARYRS